MRLLQAGDRRWKSQQTDRQTDRQNAEIAANEGVKWIEEKKAGFLLGSFMLSLRLYVWKSILPATHVCM